MQNETGIDIRSRGFNLGVTLFVGAFHILAVVGLWFFTWESLMVAVALWWIAGSLGIGIGYHRLLTHRGYRTPKAVEYFLTTCGTLAMEGGSVSWVATHRAHHTHAEREGDPHSPRHGIWWSHMGWIVNGQSMHWNTAVTAKHAADLARSPFHMWITRLHFIPQIVLGLGLFALGGWSFVLWGVFMRVVVSWHFTWLVNSAAHLWGQRRFETRDDSRNNWWVALVSFGEGWHNNHHAHPSSARHGLAWYEFDINWLGIRGLQLLGVAKDIRVAQLPKSSVPSRDDDQLADAA